MTRTVEHVGCVQMCQEVLLGFATWPKTASVAMVTHAPSAFARQCCFAFAQVLLPCCLILPSALSALFVRASFPWITPPCLVAGSSAVACCLYCLAEL